MPDIGLTADELTGVIDASAEDLQTWQQHGLLTAGRDGRFDADAVDRARLLRFITDRGAAAADIARLAETEEDLLGRWFNYIGRPTGRSRSLDEAAARPASTAP